MSTDQSDHHGRPANAPDPWVVAGGFREWRHRVTGALLGRVGRDTPGLDAIDFGPHATSADTVYTRPELLVGPEQTMTTAEAVSHARRALPAIVEALADMHAQAGRAQSTVEAGADLGAVRAELGNAVAWLAVLNRDLPHLVRATRAMAPAPTPAAAAWAAASALCGGRRAGWEVRAPGEAGALAEALVDLWQVLADGATALGIDVVAPPAPDERGAEWCRRAGAVGDELAELSRAMRRASRTGPEAGARGETLDAARRLRPVLEEAMALAGGDGEGG